jgi:hypothetical protein
MRAGDFDHAVYRFSNRSTRLVAVDAKVALTTVKGLTLESIEHYWGCGLQSPVITGVGRVNLVASAAVLAGWVRISSLNLAWV